MIYAAIVLLPLAGALIAGLFGRIIGDRPSEVITTSLLMVAAVLSWIVSCKSPSGTRRTQRHC